MQGACSAACAAANEPSGRYGCSRGHGRPRSRADRSPPSMALWGKRGTCRRVQALQLAGATGKKEPMKNISLQIKIFLEANAQRTICFSVQERKESHYRGRTIAYAR